MTVDTYNRAAANFVGHFGDHGARVEDIERAFELAGNPQDAHVLELGCGDGRDAKEILKRTSNYLGTDISEGLLEIARKYVPEAKFELADMASQSFPDELDVIFAFASMLHLNKEEVQTLLQKAAKALKPGGVFYISMKYAPEYGQNVQEDKFGKRLFYFYNPELVAELAGDQFEVAGSWQADVNAKKWFEIALRRRS